jgi:hypothetical protein
LGTTIFERMVSTMAAAVSRIPAMSPTVSATGMFIVFSLATGSAKWRITI